MILNSNKGIELLAFEDKDHFEFKKSFAGNLGIEVLFSGTKEQLLNMPEEFLLSVIPVKYSQSYSKLGWDGCWYDTEPYPEELYNFKTKRWRRIISGHHLNPNIFTEKDSIGSAIEKCPGNYYLIIKTEL